MYEKATTCNLKYKDFAKTYYIKKSPAIVMITGLNFNIQMIYSSKKGRVKGRVLIDLYCYVLNLTKRKNA